MLKSTSSICLASLLALGLHVAPAQAQNPRTFVSGNGVNNVTCQRANPCQSFQAAHDVTSPGGVIVVLDPCGACGALTINRSISIIGEGVPSGMLVSGGFTGITINAAGIDVTLRGLTIEGIDNVAGAIGIRFAAGKSLTLEHCTVHSIAGTGILFTPATSASLTVNNTLVLNNAGDGIAVAPTGSGAVTGTITQSHLVSNGFAGLDLSGAGSTGFIEFIATDSVAANNGTPGNGAGFLVQSAAGKAGTALHLVRSVAANNPSNGVVAFGNKAFVNVSETAIVGNASGWLATGGGAIFTYQDNQVLDNTSNPGPVSPLSKQ